VTQRLELQGLPVRLLGILYASAGVVLWFLRVEQFAALVSLYIAVGLVTLAVIGWTVITSPPTTRTNAPVRRSRVEFIAVGTALQILLPAGAAIAVLLLSDSVEALREHRYGIAQGGAIATFVLFAIWYWRRIPPMPRPAEMSPAEAYRRATEFAIRNMSPEELAQLRELDPDGTVLGIPPEPCEASPPQNYVGSS
jgi:hypothetical protein